MQRHVWWMIAALAACSGPASAVRPADPTFARTVGEQCGPGDAAPRPLVVDWRPESRADLEVAMRRGVAVVAYDCHELRLLPDCTIDGRYGFVGVTAKHEQLALDNSDEIRANLPAGVLAASGSIDRGAALDVQLWIAGKQMASVLDADPSLLRGHCEGATHFVRAVTTGAFTLETHTSAKLAAQAAGGGAGGSAEGSSDKQVHEQDGDPNACASVTPATTTPPAGCTTPLRLELVAMRAPAAAPVSGEAGDVSSALPPVASCPIGFAWSDGACRAAATAPRTCSATGDVEACRSQCESGRKASCTELGMAYLTGRAVALDRAAATHWFEVACDGGEPFGCYDLGAVLLVGQGVAHDPRRAVTLLERACAAEPKLCDDLAVVYRDGMTGIKDPARAAELFSRACLGGDAMSCFDLSIDYDAGRGVERDDARSLELAQTACRGNVMHACAALGTRYLYGKTVKLDETVAVALFRRACDGHDAFGCSLVGMAKLEGLGGTAKDERAGHAMMSQACENDHSGYSCAIYGLTLRQLGDEGRAQGYLQRACDAGLAEYCPGHR